MFHVLRVYHDLHESNELPEALKQLLLEDTDMYLPTCRGHYKQRGQ